MPAVLGQHRKYSHGVKCHFISMINFQFNARLSERRISMSGSSVGGGGVVGEAALLRTNVSCLLSSSCFCYTVIV